jgi:DNA replication protein DnaC
MKLEKLAEALRQMRDSHNLDAVDLLVLDEITYQMRSPDPVTIMEVIKACDAASPATVHTRIKKLCAQNILRKDDHPGSLRYKVLARGELFNDLTKQLAGV